MKWLEDSSLPLDFDDIAYRTTIEPMREDEMLIYAQKTIKESITNAEINEVSELLKYKYQVILQGPPGTGKTRLAKLVAKKLTQTERKVTPEFIINNLIRNFDTKFDEAKLARTKNDKLLSRFYESFPKDSLGSLSLSEYAIGHGANDSLC